MTSPTNPTARSRNFGFNPWGGTFANGFARKAMNKSDAPQIISLSAADLEKLLGELRGPLAPSTYQLVEALLRTLQWVMAALQEKTATVGRLRRMIFGEKTEKACKIL